MKTVITNSVDIGGLTLTLETAIFARKRNGKWLVHLNYHKVTVRYQVGIEGDISLLRDGGLSIQTSRDNDWFSGFCLLLGAIGVVVGLVKLIKNTLTVISNVQSLVPMVLDWLYKETAKYLDGKEPQYLTRLNEANFVLTLVRDGTAYERRLPRWRNKRVIEG